MSSEITYMDCWHFIAPLIPVNSEYAQDIYVKTFRALKDADERCKQKNEEARKHRKGAPKNCDTRNEFIIG